MITIEDEHHAAYTRKKQVCQTYSSGSICHCLPPL